MINKLINYKFIIIISKFGKVSFKEQYIIHIREILLIFKSLMDLILLKLLTNHQSNLIINKLFIRQSNLIINKLLIRDSYINYRNNKFKEKFNNYKKNRDSLLVIVERLITILEAQLFN